MKYVLRPLFTKFQKELVSYCNTQTGRDFISTFGGKELKENYKVVKVTPDSVHQQLDKKTFRAIFYPKSPYIGKFAEVLTYCDIAEANKYKVEERLKEFVIPHYLGETGRLKSVLPTIYLDSGTFNPNANPESTSVDGRASHSGTNVSWATLTGGAGSSAADSDTEQVFIDIQSGTTAWAGLHRSIFLFDCSSISGSIISSAVLSVYGTGKGDTFAPAIAPNINVYSSAPASNTAVVAGDFDSCGTTSFCDTPISYASFNTAGYNDFTFNANGISSISGVSKYSIRNVTYDVGQTTPTYSASKYSYLQGYYSDNGSNKPKLVVTYTLPMTGGIIII